MSVVLSEEKLTLARDLQSLTGENVMLCYQCKKCTLGCPAAYTMKMKPHEMMRAIQLGLTEEIYWSGMIWMCLSCETCNTRCPQGIGILRLINGLREMARRFDYYNPYPGIASMYRIFMALVKRFGRIYELGLALLIHLGMLTPYKDIALVYPMVSKGKLNPLPPKSRGAKELQHVMSKIRSLEQAEEFTSPGRH
jgi:heterodisulfide reductase subunit C